MRKFSSLPRHLVLSVTAAALLTAWSSHAQSLKTPAAPAKAVSQALNATAQPSAPVAAGVRTADFIVAIVNSEPVTNNQVRARAQRVLRNMQEQGVNPLPTLQALAPEVLERLIVEKAQITLAQDTGIRVDDYAVDQAVANVAMQNGVSVEDLLQEVKQQGLSEASFKQDLREQLLLQRLREREVDGRVRVSEQDIDQYLAEQRAESARGDAVASALNLAHILVAVPEGASASEVAQAQAHAEAALKALQSGADLEATAKQYSSAGEPVMGMRPANRYPALFAEATQTAAVGAVVGPLRSGAGFHVLKVLDKSADGVSGIVTQNHARHILLRTSAQLSERQAAQQLAELRDRIERGAASFSELARQHSQDGSAAAGGDLGWSSPGQFVPEFEQALNALQPGQVSQPIVSRFGVHLIMLEDRRQAQLSPREQREMLRNVVREEKLEKAYATWIQELRGQAYVEYREPPQ